MEKILNLDSVFKEIFLQFLTLLVQFVSNSFFNMFVNRKNIWVSLFLEDNYEGFLCSLFILHKIKKILNFRKPTNEIF